MEYRTIEYLTVTLKAWQIYQLKPRGNKEDPLRYLWDLALFLNQVEWKEKWNGDGMGLNES